MNSPGPFWTPNLFVLDSPGEGGRCNAAAFFCCFGTYPSGCRLMHQSFCGFPWDFLGFSVSFMPTFQLSFSWCEELSNDPGFGDCCCRRVLSVMCMPQSGMKIEGKTTLGSNSHALLDEGVGTWDVLGETNLEENWDEMHRVDNRGHHSSTSLIFYRVFQRRPISHWDSGHILVPLKAFRGMWPRRQGVPESIGRLRFKVMMTGVNSISYRFHFKWRNWYDEDLAIHLQLKVN